MSKPPTRRRKANAAPTPLEPKVDPLWGLWKDLVAQFSMGRLLANIAFTKAAWGIYGVDVISSLRATKTAQAGLAVLAGVPDPLLARLADLAALNAGRSEAMWRMAALFYVTVPVTIFLAGVQGAPAFISYMLQELGLALAVAVFLLTIWLLYYFANNWRAQQIKALITLERIERQGR